MSWVIAIGLAAIAFVVAAFVLKAPRAGWEAIGAALLIGIAGYGLQANPGLRGAPKAAVEKVSDNAELMVEARKSLGDGTGDSWVVTADAFARRGHYADAAGLLLGAVEKDPKNSEAWLALANALVGHADGTLTPAARFAFRHASETAPEHPGPPFFYGLALAQSGRFDEARALWAQILERSPADAPWRADLTQRLAQLDALIARQKAAAIR